ncbi:MAG: glycosyltransferase N-terminal domain-containing protein [Paracoccaceae bacterium]
MRFSGWVIERLGLPAVKPERTLWLVGETFEAFEAMAAAIEAIGERYSRSEILLSASYPALRARLVRRFPECRVLPPPADHAFFVRLFLRHCNVRVAVFLEPKADPPAVLLTGLSRLAIATLAVTARGAGPLRSDRLLAAACEAFIEIAEAEPDIGREDGRCQRLSVQEAADLLGELLARDLKPLRQVAHMRRGVGASLLALAGHPRWRRLTAWRLQRYSTIAELRETLGTPNAILCLGNGPSSEDPILAEMNYDALFRVNHSWLKRGLFTGTDVVFTGGKTTMRALSRPIFGLQTRYAEERFAEIRTLSPSFIPARFFDANDMTAELRAFPWGTLRPTNGASMLAVAVALQPARLIVAGIDLFQHRDGSYPGDAVTPNAYSPGHNRDTELSFLLNLLSNYHGDLLIIGEVLRSEWETFRNDACLRQIDL